MLTFNKVHDGYFAAMPDGTDKLRYGEALWVLRTTPASLRLTPATPYRIEDPDGYIVAKGLTLAEAMKQADRLAVNERMTELGYPGLAA